MDAEHSGRRTRKTSGATLADTANTYFREGRSAAREAYQATIGRRPGSRACQVVTPREAHPVYRTDADVKDRIHYESYGLPGWWAPPYSVLKVRFEPRPESTDYMYHAGEELLVPLDDDIRYRFCFAEAPGQPRRVEVGPLPPRSLLRINPSIPHHTWVEGDIPAEAWMIFRHLSGTVNSISLEVSLGVGPTRRVSEKDLQDPARYSLLAWTIAEHISLARERAGLTVSEAAKECEVDASFLSRLERGATNVSVEKLERIAAVLNVDLDLLIAPEPWAHRKATAFSQGVALDEKTSPPDGFPHHLHPAYLELDSAHPVLINDKAPLAPSFSTWIVLDGSVIFTAHEDESLYLVQAGSVVHFRHSLPKIGRALDERALVVRIDCSDLPGYSLSEVVEQ